MDMHALFPLTLALSIFAAGCAQVPDKSNPVRIWDAASRGDNLDESNSPPPPGVDKPFPELSTVPDRPKSELTPAEQHRLKEELKRELERAKETDRDLRDRTS